MSPSLQLLQCDSASISFPSSIESTEPPVVASERTQNALRIAAEHLANLNDVVAFPTETVYGLGANAFIPSAVSKIFSAKGRPSDNPLIVHVSSLPMLESFLPKTYTISPTYRALISKFWPGALTLLFPVDPEIVPKCVTAGHPTVAVRMPAHPVARALIAFAKQPLAAPSANSSGKPSPTRAEHVLRDLGARGKVEVILDGGPCEIGLESTVVDGLSEDGNIRVLRPGGVTVEDLESVLSDVKEKQGLKNTPNVLVHKRDYQDTDMEIAPTTPGMKYRHYAPSVPVVMLSKAINGHETVPSFPDAIALLQKSHSRGSKVIKIGLLAPSDSPLVLESGCAVQHFPLGAKEDPATSAARLFDGLLTLEADGVDVILIEEIPEDHEGLAFMNRARKAAGEVMYLR